MVALWMNNIQQIHSFRGVSVFPFQEQGIHSLDPLLWKRPLAWGRALLGKGSAQALCRKP